jgi:hypothetical protein
MLKKLLMVMLVPMLVLGLMGCGDDYETGMETVAAVQGSWYDQGSSDVWFILAAGQATVFDLDRGNLAFRTEFNAGNAVANDAVASVWLTTAANNVSAEAVAEIAAAAAPFAQFVDGALISIRRNTIEFLRYDDGLLIGSIDFLFVTGDDNRLDDAILILNRIIEVPYMTNYIPPVGVYNRTAPPVPAP